MEDDIMINIKRSAPKGNEVVEKKVTKTDIKRIKYTEKMKRNTSNGKHKNVKSSSKGLFPNSKHQQLLSGIPNRSSEAELANNSKIQQGTTKIQTPIQRPQRRTTQRNQQRQRDSNSFKKEDRRPRQNNVQFKPEQRKDVKIDELLQQTQKQENNIDRNDLDYFKLEPKLKDSLINAGVGKLTEIQAKSYEKVLNRVDVIIKASTGSGKTLAYLVPLVNNIIKTKSITKREDGTAIIVLCPTRELCVQAQKQVGRCLKRCPFIIPGCLFGGEETNHEKARLRKGTNILFCTPGRILYHLENTKSFKLNSLQTIVFEEADRTMDMGFQESIHKILEIIGQKTDLSEVHKILVSAHFNSKVSSLLEDIKMKNAQFIGFDNKQSQMKLENLKDNKDVEINTSAQLKQQYVLASEEQKIPLMLAYLGVLSNCKALIFVSTIDEVEFFDYLLNNLKFRDSNGNDTDTKFEKRPIYKIHGDLDQKLRSKTYLQFRQSKEAILISTEVASRGLDFPDLSHIILYDVPPTITDYGNRVGRSARFNQTGVSLMMLHYLQSDHAQKIRYYAPSLQLIDKDIIYDSFGKVLKSMNIGDSSLHYIEGLVRSSVKYDAEKYNVARKAYVSMLRAYARLPDRNTFAVKKLNLKLLARSFGLNNAQADKNYNPKAKNSHLETIRKKRKVEDVKKLQFSEYM